MLLLAWFYIGWFGCLGFAHLGLNWPCFLFAVVAFIFWRRHESWGLRPFVYSLFFVSGGVAFDMVMAGRGLIQFPLAPPEWLIPGWLVAIWILYASVIPATVKVFGPRYPLGALMGAIFGPLSYRSGVSAGVMEMASPQVLLIYAVFWAFYFPLSIYVLLPHVIEQKK